MADDPTRYLDVSGVLALKPGSTVDVDYTVTHARSVAARDRELGASVQNAQDAMFDVVADLEARWTTSNIAIDTDGTPYISPGSMTTRILIDSDGTPYVAPTGVGA